MIFLREGRWSLVVLIAAIAASGCGKSGSKVAQAPPTGKTPSREEAETFAKKLEAAMNAPGFVEESRFLDWDRLFDRAVAGIELAERDRPKSKQGFLSGVRQGGGVFGPIRQQIQPGGSYRLLRVHSVDGKPRALFRMMRGDGGINYHDLFLVKTPLGAVVAEDAYIFATGERLSETYHRIFVQLAAQQNRGLFDRLVKRDQAYVKSLPTINNMIAATRRKDGRSALALFATLPEEVRRMKFHQILRLQAATQPLNAAEYERAITEFRELFPSDRSLALFSIDYYSLRKEFDNALAAVDRLDRSIGGDPCLDYLRAGIFLQQDRLPKADAAIRRALKAIPDLLQPHWMKLAILLKQAKHEETLSTLKDMDRRFKMNWMDFRFNPQYAGFVSSPQHAQWLAYLRTKK